jgi:hypothetical protein
VKDIKRTPIDIESILEYGIDKWYKEFNWPISWQEFLDIEDKCKKVLNDHIGKYPDYADIILINYKVFIEYSNLIYALFVLKNAKYEPMISKENKYFDNIAINEIPGQPIISFPNLSKTSYLHKRIYRFLKRYLKDNKFRIPNFFKHKKYIFSESRSNHTLEYLQKESLGSIMPMSFFDIYSKGKNVEISDKQTKEIDELVKSIVLGVCKIGNSLIIELTSKQQTFLLNTTNTLFIETNKALQRVKNGLSQKKIELYIACNNNNFSRIMSVAVRSTGGKVYGFTHGEPLIYDNDYKSWIDLSLNDYYFEYTDLLRDELRKVIKKYPPLNNNKCKIESMKLSEFDEMFYKKEHFAENDIKKVMLIGNFYRDYSFTSVTAMFSVLQFHVELSIILELQNEGYDVIYKIHPENLKMKEIMSLFPKDIEINSERFENIVEKTDAFAFYYLGTTTFGHALISRNPILFIDCHISELTINLKNKLFPTIEYIETEVKKKKSFSATLNKIIFRHKKCVE